MSPEKASSRLKEISSELIEMARIDQEMRNNFFQADAKGKEVLNYFDPEIDKRNTIRLKKIIEEIGDWPTISLVGEQASFDAWLIAQHADHDLDFQKKCFELMTKVADEVSKKNIAYLSDRISVHENRPQLYGTQFANAENGSVKMGNVIDHENLDKRRAEMGLEPFAKYLANYFLSKRTQLNKSDPLNPPK